MPSVERMYSPAHALRRVERALNLVRSDSGYESRIKGWELVKSSHHVNLNIETAKGNCAIQFPAAFQPMDAIRSTIVERLNQIAPASVEEAPSKNAASMVGVSQQKKKRGVRRRME